MGNEKYEFHGNTMLSCKFCLYHCLIILNGGEIYVVSGVCMGFY